MNRDLPRDLPEGVINAEPEGGWESEEVADDVSSAHEGADPTVPVEGVDPDLQTDGQAEQ